MKLLEDDLKNMVEEVRLDVNWEEIIVYDSMMIEIAAVINEIC